LTQHKHLNWREHIAPGLGGKVLSILLFAFFITLVINAYYSITTEKKALRQQMDREGNQLTKASAIFSTEFLLLEDYPMLSTYTNGLIENHPDIQHIIIKRQDNKIVASSYSKTKKEIESFEYYFAEVLVNTTLIGNIEIAFSTVNHQAFVNEHLNKIVIQSLSIFILLSLILFIIIRKMLTDPIHQLALQADNLKNGDMEKEISLGTKGELHYLASVLNQMRINVKQSQDEIIKQNRQLDLRVVERSEELKEANKELIETHSKLIQSDKMAAIGQLSAGVAHEINNPIGYVTSNIALLDEWLEVLLALIEFHDKLIEQSTSEELSIKIANKKVALDFDYIQSELPSLMSGTKDGLDRVCAIVSDLKEFAHISESTWHETDLLAGLRSTLNIVSNEIKYKAEIILDLMPMADVSCIPQEINQVFLNIIINAGQAIKEKGTITIRSKQVDDTWVCISISDSGEGIPKDKLARIFDPFYTSKPVGVGTGLGLSVSYGIIQSHQGRIEVESIENKGTCFHIWLPIKQPDDM